MDLGKTRVWECSLVFLHLLEKLIQGVRDEDVVLCDQIWDGPAISCEPRLYEILRAFMVDLLTVDCCGLESETILLVWSGSVLTVLSHYCTEFTNFLEESSTNIEVASADAPSSDELEYFDLEVSLQVDVIDDQDDALWRVCRHEGVLSLADVLLFDLAPKAIHGQVCSHWDRHSSHRHWEFLLEGVQDDSLRRRLWPNESDVLVQIFLFTQGIDEIVTDKVSLGNLSGWKDNLV